MGQSLRVLVVETGGEAIEDCDGGKVFAGDHLQTFALTILLLPDQLVDLRIGDRQRIVQRPD